MNRAAEKYRDKTTLESTKTRAKFGGTQQKGGHASLNGYVLAVVGNKCVDVEALSIFSRGCKMWGKKKVSPEYIA